MKYVTSGDIARNLDKPVAKVRFVLAYQKATFPPVGRAGLIRLYSREVIPRVGAELDRIAARQAKVAVATA